MIDLTEAKIVCRIEEQKLLVQQLGLSGWEKYLNEDQFLSEKMEIFQLLNLDIHPHARVLDIGAGIGHFGGLCKRYGHEYLGTHFGRTKENLHPFFVDAGLEHVECGLFPYYDKKIPEGPWDAIVMIRTTFELNEEWSSSDWRELVQECMKQLKDGGQLLIKSNLSLEQKRKYGRLEYQCQERMLAAFPNKSPLPQWQWATWHWIKE